MLRAAYLYALVTVMSVGVHTGVFVTAAPSRPPHIVFILVDDLGFNDVGFTGASDVHTPNIDALARSGLILHNYYVQHGVIRPTSPYGLTLNASILPQQLAGYRTAAVGKWHLGFFKDEYCPWNRGFNHFFGYLLGAEDHYYHNRSDSGIDGFDLRNDSATVSDKGGVYSTYMFTNEAIRVVRAHDQSSPLFLYLPYQNVHAPLQAPDVFTAPYAGLNATDRRKTKAGMSAAVDSGVANVTQALKDVGMYENTLIVFSTDNGGPVPDAASNYPLRGSKATLWEGGVRGAAFVHGGSPSVLPRTGLSNDLMHVTDWLPTLAAVAGSTPTQPKDIDGLNLWPTLSQGAPSPRTEIVHNLDPIKCKTLAPNGLPLCGALRQGDMKLSMGHELQGKYWKWYHYDDMPANGAGSLVHCVGAPPKVDKQDSCAFQGHCLFNITADPCEYHDLSKKMPEVAAQLMARLMEVNATVRTPLQLEHPSDPEGADPAKHGGFWSPWK